MQSPLEQKVLESIRRDRTILPGSRVGVAVSGGADSVALLRVLDSLSNELGITLLVVHLNHLLRGEESDRDARFAENLAGERGLRFVERVEDVGVKAKGEGWNLEDAGRRLRRQFFENLVQEGVADRIAVAHTADDQAETLLAHLMRGTGMTGLGGIYPVAGPVVRPLLGTRRKDLREYLRVLKQSWREDSTNSDTLRMRARIRMDLLPVIERDFSPAIVEHLSEFARLAQEEERFWNAFVEEMFAKLTRNLPDGLRISVDDLLAPIETQRSEDLGRSAPRLVAVAGPMRTVTERLVRRLYEAVRGNRRELSAAHVEQVIALANHLESGRVVELPRGIIARREFKEIVFARTAVGGGAEKKRGGNRASAAAYQYVVQLPLAKTSTVSVAELGKRLSLNLIDWPSAQSDTIRDSQALDADLLRSPLILRNWRPGDAYRPRGRRVERKLKQMMLAERVPASQRGSWPVLESAGQVVWALGMAPAVQCSARAETRKVLLIREEPG